MNNLADVLVLGAGPAALCITSELVKQGLKVQAIASKSPLEPWPNTYGIWAAELEPLGMESLLEHRWTDTISYFGDGVSDDGSEKTNHYFDYGLFDQNAFQNSLVEKCNGLSWIIETVEKIVFSDDKTIVKCSSGAEYFARLVIDASGHSSPFVRRSKVAPIAKQAAYGVVGRFTSPPVEKNQFVLMDFRPNHLTELEKSEPPSFLYAMDFGNGIFFVEETSLAFSPPLPFDLLRRRLHSRLSNRGIEIVETIHEEHCLFPMNLPLPDLNQPLLAFGGAASMVHPASGYLVGSLLRRAPALAKGLAEAISTDPEIGSSLLAKRGWMILWTPELVTRRKLYEFGLQRLMSFDESLLRSFFDTFFKLPRDDWYGYLANTLPLPRLFFVMLKLFAIAPIRVKLGMTGLWSP